MKQHNQLADQYRQLLALIEISEAVVAQSTLITEPDKRTYLAEYKGNKEEAETYFKAKKGGALKQLEAIVLTPWNETYDEDSKRFWTMAAERGLAAKQEDHLKKILARGRIANEQEYDIVQDSIVIWQQEGRITSQQAAALDGMLGKFEQ